MPYLGLNKELLPLSGPKPGQYLIIRLRQRRRCPWSARDAPTVQPCDVPFCVHPLQEGTEGVKPKGSQSGAVPLTAAHLEYRLRKGIGGYGRKGMCYGHAVPRVRNATRGAPSGTYLNELIVRLLVGGVSRCGDFGRGVRQLASFLGFL